MTKKLISFINKDLLGENEVIKLLGGCYFDCEEWQDTLPSLIDTKQRI